MSKGPGKLQRSVTAYLEGAGPNISFEKLRWDLLVHVRGSAAFSDENLPSAWNSSLSRAIKRLKTTGEIRVQKRPLATLEELASHYPSKTLRSDIRSMRIKVIPLLAKWSKEPNGPRPAYDYAENEKFYLNSRSVERRAQLAAAWESIRPQLIAALNKAWSRETLRLISRGEDIFGDAQILVRRSLHELALKCERENVVPGPVMTELKMLVSELMSDNTRNALQLKSLVREIAHVPNRGQCSLKDATMGSLYRLDPELIESLPGFVPSKDGRTRYDPDFFHPRHRHSPLLENHLVDHTIFHKFSFLQLN